MSGTTNRCPRWQEARLGDILPLKYGKARSEQYGYPRQQTTTFGSNGAFGIFPRALTYGPSLLVGRKGAAGAVHYSAEPCWPIDTTYYTEGNERLHLPFFRYLLESLKLVQLDRSTAIPSLSRDDYNSKIVKYPKELPEQHRIVAEIEKQFTRLDAGVSALKRVQANLKRYRAAVLKTACEGTLVPTEAELAGRDRSYESGSELLTRILAERRKNWAGRGKYKEPAAPDTTNLPKLPEGWVWATVATVCERVVDCHNKTAPYTENGIPLVRTTNIRNGKINLEETKFVSQPTYEFWSRRCIPRQGDVLFTREAPMGEAGIIPNDTTLCMGQRMMLMRASSGVFNHYLLATLLAPGLINHITRTAVGSGVKHLRVHDVELLPIPLPPLAEQTRIVAEVERRLSVVDELEATVSANLQRAVRLRQAILQKAFGVKF